MIVGLAGKCYSGKNTAADCMNDFISIAFASPLKEAVGLLYSISHNQMEYKKDIIDERWGKSPRQLLQTLGTFLRTQDPDIFVKNCQQRIKRLTKNNHDIVVTDVRYDNEADMIRSMGGVIIEIKRTNPPFVSNHESEMGVSSVDYVIYNDTSITDLNREINELIEKLKEMR